MSVDAEAFVRDGFVRVPAAVDASTVATCRDELWSEIGYDRDDSSTWAEPVVRVWHMHTPAFVAAANAPALITAFDDLVGPGRWKPRMGLGTLPLRFPHPRPAGDTGWHIDGGYADDAGAPRIALDSRGRALLMLFLLTDVGPDDAPTRIRVGSHRAAARVLAAADGGTLGFMELAGAVEAATEDLPVVDAVGTAGDVYLCHPFLLHAAQDIRGDRPRFIAQPPLEPIGTMDPYAADPSPVETAVRDAVR